MNAAMAIRNCSGTVGRDHAWTPAAAGDCSLRLAARPIVCSQNIFYAARRHRRRCRASTALDHARRCPGTAAPFAETRRRRLRSRRSAPPAPCRRPPRRCAPAPGRETAPGPALRNPGGRPAECRAILHPRRCRSGQPSACAIGVRMSGLPSCASIEPSMYSTSECTMLCGCTTTSTCARRQGEQQAGLDQLQALVHQRGRVDGDLAPHHPARVRASLVGRDIT